MFALKLHERDLSFCEPDEKPGSLKEIDIDRVYPNPNQPRKLFSNDEIYELSRSIKEYGLIQPITVRPTLKGYELVAGERRLRACRLAGMSRIAAYIIDVPENSSAVMALIENVQRQDLHFFEEAMAIGRLIKEHNLTQEKVSAALGKKQSTIANKLRLLKLDKEVMSMIISYELTERHARALLKVEAVPLQKMIIETVHKKGLNVKKTEELIDGILFKKAPREKAGSSSRFICDNRIYINSVKAVYNSIRDKGVNTDFDVREEEGRIVMSIIINK